MMPHGDQIREVGNHNNTKKTTVRDVRCRVSTVRERQKNDLYLNSRTSGPCFFLCWHSREEEKREGGNNYDNYYFYIGTGIGLAR